MHHPHNQATVLVAVILYFDHLLITANQRLIGQMKDQMKMRFWMDDVRSISICLGMNLKHNREHHTGNIYQYHYMQMILAFFSMDESRPLVMRMAMKLYTR
jgi:hypothetical protein